MKAKQRKRLLQYKDFIERIIKGMRKQNGEVFVRVTVTRMKMLGKNLFSCEQLLREQTLFVQYPRNKIFILQFIVYITVILLNPSRTFV